jgi:hypothetical protein
MSIKHVFVYMASLTNLQITELSQSVKTQNKQIHVLDQQIRRLPNLEARVLDLEQKNRLLTVRVETLYNQIEAFETWRTNSSIAMWKFQQWYDEQQKSQTPKQKSEQKYNFREDPNVPHWAKILN